MRDGLLVDRVLPHDLDAERAALGSVLVNPAAVAALADLVPADFFRDAHRRIFRALRALYDRGDAIDFLTLKTELARSGELEEVGGLAYIASLADGVPRSTNAAAYGGLVRELARARAGIALLTKAREELYTSPEALTNGLAARVRDQWDQITTGAPGAGVGFSDAELEDAVDVATQGRAIDARGVPYVLDRVIPALGMLGFLVAFAKVGKTTFGQRMAAAIAMGRPFLDRPTVATKVLMLAPEDPPEYTAWLARDLDVDRGRLLFRRLPLILKASELDRLVATVAHHQVGLVLLASWQAVVRTLIRDENDNAGAVRVVETVKAAARQTGIPWLIDAHSGKAEDQADEADPSKAMRGASGAAGAADYTLFLRYANGTFGTQRKLSGKGRFVSFAPITMEFDPATSTYSVVGEAAAVTRESTWRLIVETGALGIQPVSITEIARAIGMVDDKTDRPNGTHRRQIRDALKKRPDVGVVEETRRGQKATLYRRLDAPTAPDAMSGAVGAVRVS